MTTETQKTGFMIRKPHMFLSLPQRIAQIAAVAAAFGFVVAMLAIGHFS